MRTAKLLLLLAGMPLLAQSPRPRVKAVDPTPTTARPQGAVALSTAEAGGARDGKRLHRLPELTATQVDGTFTSIGSLPHPEFWLLLYRGLRCVPCDQVLSVLTASGDPALRSGTGLVVLVDGGPSGDKAGRGPGGNDRLRELRARYDMLTGAAWLEDRRGAALAALKPHGQPVLYAMHGSTIAWSAPGRIGDGKTLASLASSWIARNLSSTASESSRLGSGK